MKAIINGGKVPQGTVNVSGAKNSATRLLAAACISDGEVILQNFPTQLVDAQHKIRRFSLNKLLENSISSKYRC